MSKQPTREEEFRRQIATRTGKGNPRMLYINEENFWNKNKPVKEIYKSTIDFDNCPNENTRG